MMTDHEFESCLDAAIESYQVNVHQSLDSFNRLESDEKMAAMPQVLDDMNKHSFETFEAFKGAMMDYIKSR